MSSQQSVSANRGVKRKHNSLTIKEKVEILKKLERGVSVRQLCDAYGVGLSTVYDIKKQKDKLMHFYADSDSQKQMAIRKTLKDGKSTEHDRVMMQWFRQRRSDGVDISGTLIMEQAKLFHEELGLEYNCGYSEGWLQRFKKRHGIAMRKVCGEKRSADIEGAEKFVDDFARFVAEEHLTPEQVYNADETALYWRCTPKKSLATEDEDHPTGFKDSKDRVTILGCSNAAGTHRCKSYVIGRSKNPRALKGVKIYPVIYRANKKGWITTDLMLEWFQKYFVPEARAHCTAIGLPNDCKIILVLDNCSAHPKPEVMNKNNVCVLYLPPNCTSVIQPQDQGILRSFKAKYRSLFMKRMLSVTNAGLSVPEFIKQFNMKDVLWFVNSAWGMVSSSTLKNGWHKLWPSMMFEQAPDESVEHDFTGFNVPRDREVVRDLLEFARNVEDPYAKDVAERLNEENVSEWMDVDNDAPIVHQYTDSEIIDMIVHPDKSNETSDEETSDEEDATDSEKQTVDHLIELSTDLIKGLEQRGLASEQELTIYYMVHERLIRERPKHLKQLKISDMLKKKKAAKKNEGQISTLENPVPSTSSTPDMSPPVPNGQDVTTISHQDDDEDPDSPSSLPDLSA